MLLKIIELKNIIHEEIGRNYKTTVDPQYTQDDYQNISHSMFVTPDNKIHVTIDATFDKSLSSPEMVFNSQEDANMYIKKYIEKLHRIQLNNY